METEDYMDEKMEELLRSDYDYAEAILVGDREEMLQILELAEKLSKKMNDYGWIDYDKYDVLKYARSL